MTRSPWAREYVRKPNEYIWGLSPSTFAREIRALLPSGAREALRLVEPGRRDVHARHIAAAAREVHAVASFAAAELEDASARREERAHLAGELRRRQTPDVLVRLSHVLAGPRAPGHRVSHPT